MSASFSRQFQLRYGLEISFSFRSRIPLSIPLQPACGPGDSGHTDLPWLAPSSTYKMAVPLAFPSRSKPLAGNQRCGSRSLPDLTGYLTARTGDGHAPPLSLSGKVVSLTFILLAPPVRFPALSPIEPQASPLVVLARQFL